MEVREFKPGDVYRIGVGIFSSMIEITGPRTSGWVYIRRDGGREKVINGERLRRELIKKNAVLVGWCGIDRLKAA